MNYCHYCGKPNIEEWTGYYNPVTGAKIMREVCPVDPCYHGAGHDAKRLHGIASCFWNDRQCKRCGYKWSSY